MNKTIKLKPETKILAEQLLEIRYPAFGELFDMRGTLAELLRKEMRFSDWKIARNRIDVMNHKEEEKATESAFVSFINCGYLSVRPPTKNYFQDIASKFINLVFGLSSFKISTIQRIGVRSKYIIPAEADFQTLKELCKERLLGEKDIFSEIFEAKIVDIGLNLNFKKGNDFFNLTTGPMEKEQMKQYLKHHEDLPNLGLYFDIDYFQKELTPDAKKISQIVARFGGDAWEKLDALRSLIFE